jgi:HEAT repeat protein
VANSREVFDRKLAALAELRASSNAPETIAELRKALKDRSGYFVSKVAALVGEFGLASLSPELLAAFDRFLKDPAKTDPQCWAKNAIVKALKDLGHNDPAVYLRGSEHIQMEPVWGGQADTAGTLRGACALALASCPVVREIILLRLADLLCDPEKNTRIDAARAFAQLPGLDSAIALRMKVSMGDANLEVVGTCFDALLAIDPRESTPFVARFVTRADEDVAIEAGSALAACGEPEALDAVRSCFEAAEPRVREAIIQSLGASRLEAAAEFLMSIIEHGKRADRDAAARAITKSRFADAFRERVAAALS